MLDVAGWLVQVVVQQNVDVVLQDIAILRKLLGLEDRMQEPPCLAKTVRVVFKHNAFVETRPVRYSQRCSESVSNTLLTDISMILGRGLFAYRADLASSASRAASAVLRTRRGVENRRIWYIGPSRGFVLNIRRGEEDAGCVRTISQTPLIEPLPDLGGWQLQ